MENFLINANVIKICVLLCIINGVLIHAIRAYNDFKGTAHRNWVPCDWPHEYVQSTKCSCFKQTMACVYDIPTSVPMSITTVIVQNYFGRFYRVGLFLDESWRHVVKLSIDNSSTSSSEDMEFYDKSFIGLSKLQTLTLTGMSYMSSFGDVFLRNDSIPNLRELTVNPGSQKNKPEILLNEKRISGLLKRPLKLLNFSNVLLYTVEIKLLELLSIVKVFNISDTIITYPSSHRTQTKAQEQQPNDTTLNQKGQQGNLFDSDGHSLLGGIAQEINQKTTNSIEKRSEPSGDATRIQLINKLFKLKTNFFQEKRVTNIEQLQQRFMTGSSTTSKEDTGPSWYSIDVSGAVIFLHNFDFRRKANSTELNNRQTITRNVAPYPVDIILTIETSFFNRFSKTDWNITLGTWNITDYHIYLKTISGRNNSLVVLNGSLILDDNNPVVSIDVSYNKLQYIAKTVLWCLKNLKRLNLSWNKLYKMQIDPEFGQLFMNLTKLQYLDLSHNSVSYLHRNIFEWNKQLEVLLLNNNELTSLGIDLNGLESLQLLDFSNNNIKFISEVQINKLSSYFDSRILPNKTINFQIILEGNPLQCACYSKMFLKMILHYPKLIYNTDSKPLKCSYQEKEIMINKDALHKADYLCKRVMIIVSSTITTTVTCVVIGILIVVWWLRRKRRQKHDLLGWFVREFVNGNLRETHLVFIAMSGKEDDRGLMQKVVRTFHTVVRKYLNTDRNVLLTGYDFTPGFPIVNEAYRMIKASCVVLAFISKSFCQSTYCMMELQEACKQNKPLILIFMEHIDEDLMTPYMLEVFKRYARGQLEQTENGEWVISPDMDKLCDAMVNLAAEQYKHNFT